MHLPIAHQRTRLDRISIELTNQCSKGCEFCHNASSRRGQTVWTVGELRDLCTDCAASGVTAVSFGGGEPLEFEGLWELLNDLRGLLFRSITTNGLLLNESAIDQLERTGVEKVHISIHFPDRVAEVERVIRQVHALAGRRIRSGINLLVQRSKVHAASQAAARIRSSGIDNTRIVYLPMRGRDTPSPEEVAQVAGGPAFQSMSCLVRCRASPRFCSIGWDKRIAWCSYTTSRRALGRLTYAGILEALDGLGLAYCGDDHGLSGSAQHGHRLVRRG